MKRIFRASALILAVAIVLLLIFHSAVLAALGHFLVKAGPPEKADIIIVLAGDGFGHRIITAGELVKHGYATKAMISGPDGVYGAYECDLAIPFAVRAGDPESSFTHLEHHARSTAEEAVVVVKELRATGVKRAILVTSNFHTRRAGNIFRRTAPEIRFLVVAAPDQFFRPDDWWHSRESSKTFAMEWMKTVADWLR